MPIVLGVWLGVAGHQHERRVHVAMLVEYPEVHLQIGPIVGQRADNFLKCVRKRHPASEPSYFLFVTQIVVRPSEYRRVTEACGLLDRSERGKLALAGAQAREFLQGQVTNDVEALAAGQGCYAAFLTPKGKMLGDLRILATEEELLLDTERATLQALFNLIRRFSIGYDLQLHKRTLERGLLSLIGPASLELADAADLGPAGEHAHRTLELDGVTARAIRTDVGLDLLADSADIDRLRSELEAAGASEVSESTAECLRVEGGRPRYGPDLDDSVIPQEAGL